MQTTKKISIVCPVYNEELSIAEFIRTIVDVLEASGYLYELLFVDDGSKDNTLGILKAQQVLYSSIKIISFSRNFGKEAALTAGLSYAKGDAVIPIDVDLQDPPAVIIKLIEQWQSGFDVVIAIRVDRSLDNHFKRLSSNWFYKCHNFMSHDKIPENAGDFRLMSRKVVDALNLLPERQRFMKGLFSWVGYKTAQVKYTRAKRSLGKSKFSGWSLWNLALDGITSFSTMPLRVWSYLGLTISMFSFLYGLYIIYRTLFVGHDVPGYASLFSAIVFLGGVQLIGIGVLGEYIGRIYMESKNRPLYIIEEKDD